MQLRPLQNRLMWCRRGKFSKRSLLHQQLLKQLHETIVERRYEIAANIPRSLAGPPWGWIWRGSTANNRRHSRDSIIAILHFLMQLCELLLPLIEACWCALIFYDMNTMGRFLHC